jgi:hypothetical protein
MDPQNPYNINISSNHVGDHDDNDYYCGIVDALSLSYVEIQPLPHHHHHNRNDTNSNFSTAVPSPSLTAAFIKRQLMIDTHRSLLTRTTTCEETATPSGDRTNPIVMKHAATKCITSHHPRKQEGFVAVPMATANNTTNLNKYLITGSLVMASDDDEDDDDEAIQENVTADHEKSVLWFRTNEPFGPYTFWPCHCIGYAILQHSKTNCWLHSIYTQSTHRPVMVNESTLVVIRNDYSCTTNPIHDASLWKDQFTGEVAMPVNPSKCALLCATQNDTTMAELQFRIRQLIMEPMYVGTTPSNENYILPSSNRGSSQRQQHIHSFIRSMNMSSTKNNNIPNDRNIDKISLKTQSPKYSTVMRDVALLVHSPNQNDDKAAIIAALASSNDMTVHIIQPSALFAKYGVYADIALPCVVHSILLQAAVRQEKICLIWDHFDTMIWNGPQSQNNMGDAALPIIHSMTLYIQTLLTSMQNDRWIPFPQNHPLYSYGSNSKSSGMVLPVHICCIAILTCPDHRSGASLLWNNNSNGSNHFSLPGMGIYRLPNLTSETRYKAFRHVLQREGIVLSKELEIKLPTLAATAIWAHSATLFQQCAQQIHHRIARRHFDVNRSNGTTHTNDTESNPIVLVATVEDVQTEFQSMNEHVRGRTNGCDVQFVSDDHNHSSSSDNDTNYESLFHTVGGNQEAKASLHDALCFDPIRRNLLSSFGITPSTGLLLYGPPGTGTHRWAATNRLHVL